MNAIAVKPVSEKKLRFLKEIKDYLCHSDLTEYDYNRIVGIFENHNSQNIVYIDRVIEKPVEIPTIVMHVCPKCASRKKQKTRAIYYRISDIENVVCEFMNITPEQIKTMSRKRERVLARGFIFHFAMKHTVMSMKSLGKRYGSRDHTTVIACLKRLNNRLDTEDVIQCYMSEITELLKPYAIKKDLTNILEE